MMKKVLFLFGQLNDGDVEWMIRSGQRRQVAAGTVLVRQGEPSESLFIVLDGRLAVWLAGREREIARLGSGEIVGEMSFIDARPPSATVKAMEGATVLAIGKRELQGRLAADPAFGARFYRALAIYLSNSLRERHRLIGYGENVELLEAEQEDPDELDANVLDTVYLAGERFDRMLKQAQLYA